MLSVWIQALQKTGKKLCYDFVVLFIHISHQGTKESGYVSVLQLEKWWHGGLMWRAQAVHVHVPLGTPDSLSVVPPGHISSPASATRTFV